MDDAIQASQWRGKRQGAERELGELRSHLDEVEGLVAWCNRGGDLFVRDAAGLKQHYSCDEARSQLERMRQRMAELEFYLEDGLAEECRRAGCLPGWIR